MLLAVIGAAVVTACVMLVAAYAISVIVEPTGVQAMSSFWLRKLINFYLPMLAAGIRVTKIDDDFRHAEVRMVLRFYNRNAVGTQFGGSLYAMTDPFYMLMLMQILGRDYMVWDKAAAIDFVSPGTGTVYAAFDIDDAVLAEIYEKTADGTPHFPQFQVNVVDGDGKIIARVHKTLYVRKKKPK